MGRKWTLDYSECRVTKGPVTFFCSSSSGPELARGGWLAGCCSSTCFDETTQLGPISGERAYFGSSAVHTCIHTHTHHQIIDLSEQPARAHTHTHIQPFTHSHTIARPPRRNTLTRRYEPWLHPPASLPSSPFGKYIETPLFLPKMESSSASIIVAQRSTIEDEQNRAKLGKGEIYQEDRSRGLQDHDVETCNGQSPPRDILEERMGGGVG